jgi:CHASE2 domain-containing sensor protein
MNESASSGAPAVWGDRFQKYREKLLEAVVIGALLAGMTKINQAFVDRMISQPWQILLWIIPLVVAGWLTWRIAKRTDLRRTHWAFPLFLLIYCAGFALLSTSELLVWKRTPRTQPETSRYWLMPTKWGDWRYALAPRPEAPADTVVMMVDAPQAENLEQLRLATLQTVQLVARAQRLRGLALDFYFEDKSRLDNVLCDAIRRLGVDVFAGYTLEAGGGPDAVLAPNGNPLEACIPFDTHEGHLLAWADADGYVRTLPLHWQGQTDRPAFSLRIAQARAAKLGRKIEVPDARMLRYVAPREGLRELDVARVREKPSLLNDKFVFVGQRSELDTHLTPFDEHSGTWVQAAAVNALLSGTYMTRASDFASALLVFVACYAIVLVAMASGSLRSLSIAAAIVSLSVLSLAAAAAYRHIWLDAIYAIVACWLLVPLVLVLRRTIPAK